jgi:hypothetical protein
VLTVTAADPDGDAITSFTPDLSQLPSGSLPRFVVSADNLTGTLTWTPTFVDSGRYTVSFTASNTKTATATTLIIVQNVDRAPVVTVPAKQRVEPGARLTFRVTASDPDGDAITSLTMDATRLPNGGSATFVVDATNTSGDFTWIAPSGQGTKQVKFTARNALSTTVQVNIQIKAGTGAEPLTEEAVTPQVLALSEPRPNPSRGEVGFALDLPRAADVSWSVYDLQGRELYSARQSHGAGRMSWSWAGRTRDGARAGAGLYLVRVQVEDQVFTRRITRF